MSRLMLVILVLLLPAVPCAQELTPRAYWPAPEGTRVVTLGLLYTDGDTVPDPSLPVAGIDSAIVTAVTGYLQTLDLWGRSANFIVELPYSTGDTTGVHDDLGKLERDYSGWGDLGVTLSVNLMGAPSMSAQEFQQLRAHPRPILGASLKLVAPTGKYDPDRLINVGANRWAAKVEVGYIMALNHGWMLELEGGSWLFGDNDDFFGLKRKQAPIIAAELHLVRRIRPGFWASIDVNGYKGGRSEVAGAKLNDLQRDSKFGLTLVFPIARGHVLKGSWATGSVNDSDEAFDFYALSYSRLF